MCVGDFGQRPYAACRPAALDSISVGRTPKRGDNGDSRMRLHQSCATLHRCDAWDADDAAEPCLPDFTVRLPDFTVLHKISSIPGSCRRLSQPSC